MAFPPSGLRVSATHLAELLGGWCNGAGPLRNQLAAALTQIIDLGELAPTAVLPPERTLAETLAVSRNTVMAAYDALRRAGLLESRQGRGTWVASRISGTTTRSTLESQRQNGNAFQTFLVGHGETVDLSSAATSALPMLADLAATVTHADYIALMHGHGYLPRGLPSLVERIAEYYRQRGLETSDDQIIVTSGSQQALELIAANHLTPGAAVVVEEPTFRGALQSFRAHGVHLKGVSRDSEGVSIASLRLALQHGQPQLVYLVPTAHNPTGGSTSAARHAQLVSVAREHNLLVIDDSSTADTSFDRHHHRFLPPDLPEEQVVTIGSLSKVFWGGLRIGWIRASRENIQGYAQLKSRMDLGSCLLGQLLGVRLMDHFEEARQQRVGILTDGLNHLLKLLTEQLPEWTWEHPRGGSSLWVRIPRGNSPTFAQVALRHGVSVEPGPMFSLTSRFTDHLRIPFKDSPTVLNVGAARLSQAWSHYDSKLARHGDFGPSTV